jgi:hypothetical protein
MHPNAMGCSWNHAGILPEWNIIISEYDETQLEYFWILPECCRNAAGMLPE